METKTVWFSVFQNVVPADYEAWLEKLALEGWNLERIGQMSSIKMTFQKTAPKRYRYVFDLNAFPKKEYKSIYEQLGWEFVGQMSSCFVWRKEYTDTRPESFSDDESIRKRNRRFRNAVGASLGLLLTVIVILAVAIGFCVAAKEFEKVTELLLSAGLLGIMAFYLVWVIRKIQSNLNR